MRKIGVLCSILLLSACAEKNDSDKKGCPTEPIVSRDIFASLNAKKSEKIGRVEVAECYLRVKKMDNVRMFSAEFMGLVDHAGNTVVVEIAVWNKQITLANPFLKGACAFQVSYELEGQKSVKLPEYYSCAAEGQGQHIIIKIKR